MTDRELLELAAKAAGRGSQWWMESPWNEADREWNPLTDDGDALRLAVKLRLSMFPPECKEDGATISAPGDDGLWLVEDPTDDACADMRRAIVRAAAEIGRAM